MNNHTKEVFAVYGAGLVQGLVLVAFPAVGGILTNPEDFNFSKTAYGGLFIPQAVLSLLACLLSAKLSAWKGAKMVFLCGLIANFCAMLLLFFGAFLMKSPIAYGLLLGSTTCLGVGFGLLAPALNACAVLFFPRALLVLNALLGLGMAISPLLVTVFVGYGVWWGLPLSLCAALFVLFIFSIPLYFPYQKMKLAASKCLFPRKFWFFAVCALVYGMIETVNGNWGVIYMKKILDSSSSAALFSLTLFWAMVTFGRVFFALIERVMPERITFQVLPFVLVGSSLLTAHLPIGSPILEAVAFGLSGFGCSAILPLMIILANKSAPSMGSSAVAGGILSAFLIGYGIAAFGVGPLLDLHGISLASIFTGAAFLALCLGVLSFFVSVNRATK